MSRFHATRVSRALDDEHPSQPAEIMIHTKSGESKWVTTSWRPIELWRRTSLDEHDI